MIETAGHSDRNQDRGNLTFPDSAVTAVSDELALRHLRLNPYNKIALQTLDSQRMPGIQHYQQFCRHARSCNFISRAGRENFDQKLEITDVHKMVELLLVCVKEDQSYPDFLKVHCRLLLSWFCKNFEEDLSFHGSFQNQLLTDTKKYGDSYRISHHLCTALARLDLQVPAHRYTYQETDFWQFDPKMRQVNPHVVIFGPGDIFLKQILPQLFTLTRFRNLRNESYLGKDTKITIVGEKAEADLVPFGTQGKIEGTMDFKRYVLESCKNKNITLPAGFEKIFDLIDYVPFQTPGQPDLLAQSIQAGRKPGQPSLFFLSVPPQAFRNIWETITPVLEDNDTVYFEKPFGINMQDYMNLQGSINKSPKYNCIYAIDHYQGKEAYTLFALMRRQFLDQYLNGYHVDSIEITCPENHDLKERNFYNQVGAVNDMLQSHMLGLLTLVAADLPDIKNSCARRFAENNLKFLKTVPTFKSDDFVVGQYDRYAQDLNLAEPSCTPTYFAGSVMLTDSRWEGVKVSFMHGKELKHKYSQVVINFRQSGSDPDCPKKVILAINPKPRLLVWFHDSKDDEPEIMKLEEPNVFDNNSGLKVEAYSRLLLHTFHGNPIANRPENIEELWRIVGPVADLNRQPHIYPAGSDGPDIAQAFEEQVSAKLDKNPHDDPYLGF